MAAVQLNFSLRTSPNVKTAHLLGSWDNYAVQLPLSNAKAGSWKGTFRFQGSTLELGQRYWYYVSLAVLYFILYNGWILTARYSTS